ncbi:MAG TPA: nitrate- and nitrite sensing domain-containing protein [Jiangellales bacterium]|nr:nitrate- and nitrite sensing domain-containing protein [Jiangellales bacterium]
MTRTAGGRRAAAGSTRRAAPRPGEAAGAAAPGAQPGSPAGTGADGGTEPDEQAARPSLRQRTSSAWNSFLHDRSVRSRVAALVLLPLVMALILGALTLRGALADAAEASTTERNAEVAAAALTAAHRVQDERDVTALAESGATGEAPVADAREAADAALADVSERLADLAEEDVAPAVSSAVGRAEREIAAIPDYRDGRDAGQQPFATAGILDYDIAVDSLLGLVSVTGSATGEADLFGQVATLDSLTRAGEAASRERATAALALGNRGEPVPPETRQQLAAQAAQQDFLVERAIAGMDSQTRQDWLDLIPGVRGEVGNARLTLQADAVPSLRPETWYEGATARLDLFREFEDRLMNGVQDTASGAADRARAVAIATALLSLLVLAATVFLAVVVARSIVGPLGRLRSAALETADTGLPSLVSRIQADGPRAVRDRDAVQPEGRDEIGQVATAFNEVHSTAVRVASEQALLRQNLDTIVVNLSRRTQTLVDRQLGEIEGLEARERDPDQLGTLFRIDHLATRVRRHAESLLVLAGVEDIQRSTRAVAVLDVVRTAVGEVEQYPRVRFGVLPTDLVAAHAVDDVAHLLAELIDNATEFSPPSTAVAVTTQPLLGGGLRLQVTDSGLGIPEERLDELNDRLRTPGDIDVAASRTLGLYVVARLAARHGIAVRLVPGAESGTVAQVDLPGELVLNPLDPEASGEIPRVVPASTAQRPGPAGAGSVDPASTAAGVAGAFQSIAQIRAATPPAGEAGGDRAAGPDRGRPPQPAGAAPVARSAVSPEVGPNGLPRRTPAAAVPGAFGQAGATAPGTTAPVGSADRARAVTGPGGLPRRGPRPASGVPAPEPVPAAHTPAPPAAEARVASSAVDDDDDLPIFNAVRSAWFGRTGADWGGVTDETWRRATTALESARHAAGGIPGGAPGDELPQRGRADLPRTAGGAPGPAATEPALTPTGLPVRKRGASLVPGTLAEGGRPADAPDAGGVAASLSSLQTGVDRGRKETKGWVPTRPDAARPDAARPDPARPDAARPDAGKPEPARPDDSERSTT